jgi:hypothetical protein
MNNEKKLSCQGCRFCITIENGIIGEWKGECRKNPPTPALIPTQRGIAVNTLFPPVSGGCYCFSFEAGLNIDN